MALRLSVVDQSPMRHGETAAEALADSVTLAQAVEQMGYSRYWVAEHHNTGTFAGTSPEILIGQILANTQLIRVGSGGVMLSHYSALKVAEQFAVLNAFYPGRVDLGLGRAPGSDQRTAIALAYPRRPAPIEEFPQQVADVVGYLHGALGSDHPFSSIKISPGPVPDTPPAVWLLGSSDYSAKLAAYLGLPFAFADFFGNTGKHGPAVAASYLNNFKPSVLCEGPRLSVAVQVICAPSKEEAQFIASSRNLSRARRLLEARTGSRIEGLAPPEEAIGKVLDDETKAFTEQFTGGYIDGDPGSVCEALENISQLYQTDDLGIVTITYHLRDRIRSYSLIAQSLGMSVTDPVTQ